MLICVSDESLSGRYYASGQSEPGKTTIVSLLSLLLYFFYVDDYTGISRMPPYTK